MDIEFPDYMLKRTDTKFMFSRKLLYLISYVCIPTRGGVVAHMLYISSGEQGEQDFQNWQELSKEK
jgi:hypothetical protein